MAEVLKKKEERDIKVGSMKFWTYVQALTSKIPYDLYLHGGNTIHGELKYDCDYYAENNSFGCGHCCDYLDEMDCNWIYDEKLDEYYCKRCYCSKCKNPPKQGCSPERGVFHYCKEVDGKYYCKECAKGIEKKK